MDTRAYIHTLASVSAKPRISQRELHSHDAVTDINGPQRIPNDFCDNLTFQKLMEKSLKFAVDIHGHQKMKYNVYGDHLTFPVAPPL